MSITGSEQWMYNAGGGFYPYTIDQSLRSTFADSSFLEITPSSAGDRQKFTFSAWIKRGLVNGTFQNIFAAEGDGGGESAAIRFDSSERLDFIFITDGADTITGRLITNRVFRDTSSWYHIVLAQDTTNGTGGNRIRLYVNGVEETSFATDTNPTQNDNGQFGATVIHRIGAECHNGNQEFDGYIADANYINGTQLGPDSFGETKSGVWVPKDTSGLTFGTNGFRLEFKQTGTSQNASGIGADTSGETNHFALTNLVASNVVLDSPTNNFSVLKIAGAPAESGAVLSQGNLKCESTAGTSARNMERSFTSTLLLKAGFKWYVEHYVTDTDFAFGLSPEHSGKIQHDSNNSRYCLIYNTGGAVMNFQSFTGVFGNDEGTTVVSTGDVVGMFVDMTVTPPQVTWSLNGEWGNGSAANQSNPTSFITLSSDFTSTDTDNPGDLVVWVNSIAGGQATSSILNFGQDSTFGSISAGGNTDANGRGDFKYAVPSDGLALCAANLPELAIDPANDETPEDYFNTLLYTGNGANGRALTGVGFQPDWTWIKSRSAARDHKITDSVRGVNKEIGSQTSAAEVTRTNGLSAFGSDGFTVGSESGYNNSGDT